MARNPRGPADHQPPTTDHFKHQTCTLRVCVHLRPLTRASADKWSEKTTVCRVFSCQRSLGALPRTPARSLAGPRRPAPSQARYARLTPDSLHWLANRPPSHCHASVDNLRCDVAPASAGWLANRSPLPRQLRRAKVGGEYRARTGDLLVANQALSQLS